MLIRKRRQSAPEPPAQTALEVLGDLYRTLDESTAYALAAAIARGIKGKAGTLSELRDPWASRPMPESGSRSSASSRD